jgi:hypothetical protein
MLGSMPAFPPFEQWQAMSEAEQDALIARMETTRRHQRGIRRFFVGLAGATAAAGICAALYLQILN